MSDEFKYFSKTKVNPVFNKSALTELLSFGSWGTEHFFILFNNEKKFKQFGCLEVYLLLHNRWIELHKAHNNDEITHEVYRTEINRLNRHIREELLENLPHDFTITSKIQSQIFYDFEKHKLLRKTKKSIILFALTIVAIAGLYLYFVPKQLYQEEQYQILQKAIASRNDKDFEKKVEQETGFSYEEVKNIAENVKSKSKSDFNLGNANLFLGDMNTAIYHYDKAISINNRFIPAYINKGFSLMIIGKYELALQAYDEVIKFNAAFIKDAYLNKGLVYLAIKDTVKALKSYESAINLDSTFSSALRSKGHILVEQHKFEEALVYFDRTISLGTKDLFDYYYKGVALSMLSRYEEALKNLKTALPVSDLDPRVLLEIGICLEHLFKLDDALSYYDKFLQKKPNDAFTHFRKGYTFGLLNKPFEAIQSFTKAIQIDNNYIDAYINRSRNYNKLGNEQDALKDCDKAMDIDICNPHSYHDKGDILVKLDRYDDAIKCYQKAITVAPLDKGNSISYNNMGEVFFGMQCLDEAIDCYNNAIRYDKNYIEAYRNIGKSFFCKGDFNQSLITFNKALAIDSTDVETYYNKSIVVLIGFQKYDEAINIMNKAILMNKELSFGYCQIIESILYSLGKCKEANYFFKKIKSNYYSINKRPCS